jgi:hypothetical protein
VRLSKLQKRILVRALESSTSELTGTSFGDCTKSGEYSGHRCLKIEHLARDLYGVTSETTLRWERRWGDYDPDGERNNTDRRAYNSAMAALSRSIAGLVRRGLLERVAITGLLGNVSRPIWLHITNAGVAVAETVKQIDSADCLTDSRRMS